MSTSKDNLIRLQQYSLKDHQFIFDMYVVSGRNLEYICIKMGMDPVDIVNLLEGYGEKIMTESGFDDSGRGRLSKLPRRMVDEYVAHFYPGIAKSEVNDWITIEGYLNNTDPNWRMA